MPDMGDVDRILQETYVPAMQALLRESGIGFMTATPPGPEQFANWYWARMHCPGMRLAGEGVRVDSGCYTVRRLIRRLKHMDPSAEIRFVDYEGYEVGVEHVNFKPSTSDPYSVVVLE